MMPEDEPSDIGGDTNLPTRLYLDVGEVGSYLLGHTMRATLTMLDGRVVHAFLIDGQSAYDGSHFMLIGREEPTDVVPG